MLNWLVNEHGIEPAHPSVRQIPACRGTFSRDDFAYDQAYGTSRCQRKKVKMCSPTSNAS